MRSGQRHLVWVLLLAASFGVGAAEQDAEVENVATPLTLAQLLPEGGIDAVDVDFWIRTEATLQDRPIDVRFMHWSIQPVDGNLVFTYDNGTKGDAKDYRRARTTYAKTGQIIDYYQATHARGKKTTEITGKVVNGELVTLTTHFDDAGQATGTKTQTRSLAVLEQTVPSEWFPLIVAYHLRKGSLSYRFTRTDLHYHFQQAMTTIKDVGTEQIEHEGKPTAARLLLGERTFGEEKNDQDIDSRLQYLVLPNGEILYMRNQYYGYQFLGRRVTLEQIKKEFWLPPPPPPPDAADQENADTSK